MLAVLLLIWIIGSSSADSQICLEGSNDNNPPVLPTSGCILNKSHRQKNLLGVKQCYIRYVLDLGQNFTEYNHFVEEVANFLADSTEECLNANIGHSIFVEPLFATPLEQRCCSAVQCNLIYSWLDYDVWVSEYASTDRVELDASINNITTFWLIDQLKRFDATPCEDNTFVFISNRIFGNMTDAAIIEFQEITEYSCTTLTMIVVGRNDIDTQFARKYYSKFTDNVYSVPDYRCLPYLADCISPCGIFNATYCTSQSFNNCSIPRPTTTTTTATTTTTTTTTITTTLPVTMTYGDWHMIFIFAISENVTLVDFENIKRELVLDPLQRCFSIPIRVAVKFTANCTDQNRAWSKSFEQISADLSALTYDRIRLHVTQPIDTHENVTLELIDAAIDELSSAQESPLARIILITDYVSQNFIDALHLNSLYNRLAPFDFEMILLNNATGDYYRSNTTFAHQTIHTAVNMNSQLQPAMIVCYPHTPTSPASPKASLSTILIIATGTGIFLLVLLTAVTICYRQKLVFLQRLNRFHMTHDSNSMVEDDLFDYWELSWDKLIVKSEKIGSGAYGQVYRGKLIGRAAAHEIFLGSVRARSTENCEVAVKMLPRYASNAAKAEFMNEIERMKSIGFNDHIVNMIGCISLQYANTCLKEFLVFAWQIADGMRFLSSKLIVHRDLAARNILIDKDNNAKISDFGLCTSLLTGGPNERKNGVYISDSGRLPIKWLAIESLIDHVFSTKTDVWSFGIVLYEMYSLGDVPFKDIDPKDLIDHLLGGHRLQQPALCTDDVYEIMKLCWCKEAIDRPDFNELCTRIADLLEHATEGYGYLPLLRSQPYRTLASIDNTNTVSINRTASSRSFLSRDSLQLSRKASSVSFGTTRIADGDMSIDQRRSISMVSTPDSVSIDARHLQSTIDRGADQDETKELGWDVYI